MTYGMIATWRMAYEAVARQAEALAKGEEAGNVLETVINEVEDFANFISVGYGGLPNEKGVVQLDAAYMDGSTFAVGAVAGMENIMNPLSVARKLSGERFNSFLVGEGAQEYARQQGWPVENLLTRQTRERWEKRVQEVASREMTPYDGHDTIGMVVLDTNRRLVAGTSSSGLFMKREGRIGDSPLPGSGYYADSDIGGASATGLGEDLMKGILSYEVVRKMAEGHSPMDAAQLTLAEFEEKLRRKYGKVGAMSLVCMNNQGEWGIATNVAFTFVVHTYNEEATVYLADRDEAGTVTIKATTSDWISEYLTNVNIRLE